jgi:hypothetical protein
MKVKVIVVTIALTITATTYAVADGVQSPRGISQSDWNASSTYQNFQCPSGTARNEGVDMNYTTNRNDDYWFVTCDPIPVYVPAPINTTTPIATVSDTATVTTNNTNTISSNTTITNTNTTVITPVATDTTTATTLTNADIYTQLSALFAKIFALLALLGVK